MSTTVLLAASLAAARDKPGAPVDSTGSVTGRVIEHGSRVGIRFVNVIELDTKRGTMTGDQGVFRIDQLPPGKRTILAQALGYPRSTREFKISPGRTTKLTVELRSSGMRPQGMNANDLKRIHAGRDVHVDANQIGCEFVAIDSTLQVGRSPGFTVRLQNRSSVPIGLIGSLDSYGAGHYPKVAIEIDGPQRDMSRVGVPIDYYTGTALTEPDIIQLAPGEEIDPFSQGLSRRIAKSRFMLPGAYRATFSYSTLESDFRKGGLGNARMPKSMIRLLRPVPSIELSRTITFEVRP